MTFGHIEEISDERSGEAKYRPLHDSPEWFLDQLSRGIAMALRRVYRVRLTYVRRHNASELTFNAFRLRFRIVIEVEADGGSQR
ncbi:MAG: hypothetical protein MJH10_09420 [Epibacterium sp.]|nr:hypothetical protein [Epibacterium sp.]NQX73755.1 hypothetical protein [Epibacterium sp.]